MIVNNSAPHRPVKLDSTREAVAVSISLNKTITLCSVYLPPSSPIGIKKRDHPIDQLPKLYIFVGDFNSHHTLWGRTDTNDKGRAVEDFITKHDRVLLNDRYSTYLHPAYWFLLIIEPNCMQPWTFSRLYMEGFTDFTWKVCDDLHGSDHYPIQISEVGPSVQQRPQRWKLHKANWEQFRVHC